MNTEDNIIAQDEITRALNQMHGNGCTGISTTEITNLSLDENVATQLCSLISQLTSTT